MKLRYPWMLAVAFSLFVLGCSYYPPRTIIEGDLVVTRCLLDSRLDSMENMPWKEDATQWDGYWILLIYEDGENYIIDFHVFIPTRHTFDYRYSIRLTKLFMEDHYMQRIRALDPQLYVFMKSGGSRGRVINPSFP